MYTTPYIHLLTQAKQSQGKGFASSRISHCFLRVRVPADSFFFHDKTLWYMYAFTDFLDSLQLLQLQLLQDVLAHNLKASQNIHVQK